MNPYFDRALTEADYDWLLGQVQHDRRRPDAAHLKIKTVLNFPAPPPTLTSNNDHVNKKGECDVHRGGGSLNTPSAEPGGTIILSAEPGGTIIFKSRTSPRTEPGGILDYFEPNRPNGTTGQRLFYCHLPTSPIDLLSRPREATVASEGVYQIWDEPERETPEQMERHEPQREESNKQSRRDEPDEDLLDHLGEPSAEPAQESNELCDVAIEGEDDCGDPDDTKPICGRARGKARIINDFISDEADSALIEKKVEDERFLLERQMSTSP